MVKKKVSWVFLTLLTVVAMILMSCGTRSTEEEEKEATVVTGIVKESPLPEKEKTEDTSGTEKPQYGGIASIALGLDQNAFDEAFGLAPYLFSLHLTNEELLQGDWTKGPAGTGETDFVDVTINSLNLKTGALADSWQIPERGTIVFHIREGVYWHNKAPCNGRAMTVDDIAFSIKRMCTEPGAYIKMSYPTLSKTIEITADETTRTLAVKCPDTEWMNLVTVIPDYLTIMPRDAIEHFRNLNDWHNSIGTGAFILTDYVSGGSMTFIKNPNYWDTNPIGPGKGDKLPYLDGVKLIIIKDVSTVMSAFRVGKVNDTLGEYDDMQEFLDNPDIKHVVYTTGGGKAIYMRTDKAGSPLSKKEVRQALTMAIDFDKIKSEYYAGKAVILAWPLAPAKENAKAYVALEKLPANVQELYSHNITKAKELLIAADHPDGFPVTIVAYNTPGQVDYLMLIKDMWADIGVTLTIDAKDQAAFGSKLKNYDEMIYYSSSGIWQKLFLTLNMSFVNDAKCNDVIAQMIQLFEIDENKMAELHASLMPYVLEQCWAIGQPKPYTYCVWWPWVKNWNGEFSVGYYNYPSYLKYIWQDSALKQKILKNQ